jgi:hypothetical protein
MTRLIVSILCISVFFIGLGALADKAGARFKSDEKALEIIRQARIAIGGDAALAEVRSMTITGRTTHTFRVDGVDRTESGETEIAMQLPDKLMKMVKIGSPDNAAGGEKVVRKRHEVVVVSNDGDGAGTGIGTSSGIKKVVVGTSDDTSDIKEIAADGKKIVVRKAGGGNAVWHTEDGGEISVEGKTVLLDKVRAKHEGMRQNELLRTTLSLLLTAPEGIDVSYTFAGDGDVDGTPVNIINAAFGGSDFKLYIAKGSSLPVMMSYTGHRMPKVFHMRTKAPEGSEETKDVMTFKRKIEGMPASETAEFQVRFADFRGVNGVQLPHRWTTSVAGQTTEVFDIAEYEVNPANIAERFKDHKAFVRSKKADQQ